MANSIMGNNAATFLIEIRECSLDAVRLTNLHALFESANRQRFLPTNDRMPNDIVWYKKFTHPDITYLPNFVTWLNLYLQFGRCKFCNTLEKTQSVTMARFWLQAKNTFTHCRRLIIKDIQAHAKRLACMARSLYDAIFLTNLGLARCLCWALGHISIHHVRIKGRGIWFGWNSCNYDVHISLFIICKLYVSKGFNKNNV